MRDRRIAVGTLEGLVALLRGAVRSLRRFAFVTVVAVAVIASMLARGGFDTAEVVVSLVLLAPPALLLVFAAGLAELLRVPERLRRLPAEGSEQVAELTRIAGEARRARVRGLPLLLWRLRGAVGSSRDLVGFALPLRVLTPGFLGLAALAAFACLLLIGAGAIALIVLALG